MTAPENIIQFMPPEARAAANHVAPEGLKCTDLGNAERLVAHFGDSIRYCPPRRRWLVWDGQRWPWDDAGRIVQKAKAVVRSIHGEASRCTDDELRKGIAKHAQRSESVARVKATIELAQSDPAVVVMPHELDAHPMLLCVANGTIDLQTGELREHRREDLITRISPVAYDPTATHELWTRVLHDATGGDDELSAFLERLAGYCATGLTTEKHFFFVFGPTNTAKSTFVGALHGALDEHAETADFDTWLSHRDVGGNRGDVVRLMGARLVSSVEVRRGQAFDESLVKKVSGGDPVTYCAKYEADVSFRPTFKLMFAANDAPRIRDDDSGMWDRCLRVPFEHVPEQIDKSIRPRLADPHGDVAPAVLAWVVQGCLRWQAEGLAVPDAVRQSTDAYRDECDLFASFADECLVFEPDAWVSKSTMREAYDGWRKENGLHRRLSVKDFRERLLERGATDGKSMSVRLWKGVRLATEDDEKAES